MAAIFQATHDAMATTFDFHIDYPDTSYARQAAKEAFAEVDRLEGVLSRFREGNDVWRINHATDLQRLRISEECHRCLLLGMEMMELTGGAFDMTIGAAVDHVRSREGAQVAGSVLQEVLAARSGAVFRIDPQVAQVEVCGFNGALDLGAIGKGFALDCVAQVFANWEIGRALLNAGGSSLLAISVDKPWKMRLRGESSSVEVCLRSGALGASGTSVRGNHIIDSRSGSQCYRHLRAWAVAPTAAEADALSTAWMTLEAEAIAAVMEELGAGYAALVESASGKILVNDGGSGWQDAATQPEGWHWG